MVNNQTDWVIVKVIAGYDNIYNIIDYIASGNSNYNTSCNHLLIITTLLLSLVYL